jgi:hypothetical protein
MRDSNSGFKGLENLDLKGYPDSSFKMQEDERGLMKMFKDYGFS